MSDLLAEAAKDATGEDKAALEKERAGMDSSAHELRVELSRAWVNGMVYGSFMTGQPNFASQQNQMWANPLTRRPGMHPCAQGL